MSIRVMSRVWEHSRQNGTALLVLLALADWSDDWGYCYPGHKSIAKKARTTERNVYLTLKKLEEEGEIVTIRRGSGGRSKVTSVYQVLVGMSEEEVRKSRLFSPIAKEVISYADSPEEISPENSSSALKVLINRQLNAADSFTVNQQHLINDGSPEEISPENFSGEKSFTENQCNKNQNALPVEIREKLKALGWRGSLADVERAWQEDPERVRQWLWYVRKQGMSGAFLRTVLRNVEEYPPELEPNSEARRRSYIEGPYAEFIEH